MVAGELTRTIAPFRMLEREAELAALEAMLAAARVGDGRLVVVEGSAGIGKTRLLAEGRSLAQAAEVRGSKRARRLRAGRANSRSGSCGAVRGAARSGDAGAARRATRRRGRASASLFASAPTSASGEAASCVRDAVRAYC